MEHLPQPAKGSPIDVKVPYLAYLVLKYDGLDLKTFLSRHGVTTDQKSKLYTLNSLTRALPANQIVAFIQSHLYFGTLRSLIGPSFDERSLLVGDDNNRWLSTQKLKDVLAPYLRLLAVKASVDNLAGRGSVVCLSISGLLRRIGRKYEETRSIVLHVHRQCNLIDLPAEWYGWSETLLAIRLLAEALHACAERLVYARLAEDRSRDRFLQGLSPDAMPNWKPLLVPGHCASAQLIQRHMLRSGANWCPHQVLGLSKRLSCSSMLFLAGIDRKPRPWTNHSACDTEKCLAYNIDDKTFKAAHDDGCPGCDSTVATLDDMYAILDTGGIPVLKCDMTASPPRLSYVRATPRGNYVAISHLWSNGLGNPSSNDMPSCQVQRLCCTILRLEHKRGWSRRLIQSLLSRLQRFCGFKARTGRTVYLWLDVYCVPVAREHGRFDLQDLKMKALARMPATYAWADYVLALDHEFAAITDSADFNDALARIVVSGWNTRYWTYHEFFMAQEIIFDCGDGFIQKTNRGNWSGFISGRKIKTSTPLRPLLRSVFRDAKKELAISLHNGMQSELEAMMLKLRSAMAMRSPNSSIYSQHIARSRAHNFGLVWNVLRDKSTSKPADLLLIFATLLDLDAAELMEVCRTREERMKGIMKSFQRLPLGILFENMPRFRCECAKPLLCDHSGDRWIPVGPPAAANSFQPSFRKPVMAVESDGLSLCMPQRAVTAHLMRLSREGGADLRYWWSTVPPSFRVSVLDAVLYVDLHGTNEDIAVMGDLEQAMFMWDPGSTKSDSAANSGGGACFMVRRTENDTCEVVFVASLSWVAISLEDAPRMQMRNIDSMNKLACEASVKDNIKLTCDTESWPTLTKRRDVMIHRYLAWWPLWLDIPVELVISFAPVVIFLLVALKIFWNNIPVFVALLVIGVVSNTITFALFLTYIESAPLPSSIYDLATSFIIMENLMPASRAGDRWWQALERVLPRSDEELSSGLERLFIRILWICVRVARAFHLAVKQKKPEDGQSSGTERNL